MRRKVTFQEQSQTKDVYGQEQLSWTDIYEAGAEMRQVSYRATEGNELKIASDKLRLDIPYSQKGLDIDTTDYVMVSGVRYKIDSIDAQTMFRKKIIVICSQYNEK